MESQKKKNKKKKEYSVAYQVTGLSNDRPISYGQYEQLMQALQKADIASKGGSFSGISHCLINSISRKAWIMDLGASDHIICDKSYFSNMHKELNIPISVQLPNGNITNVTLTGTVRLSPHPSKCPLCS